MSLGFWLTDEQEALRRRVHEFASREIAPLARQIDRTDAMPARVWQLFAAQGYPAMAIAKEWGGSGDGLLEQTLMMEEVTAGGKSPVCIALLESAALFTQAVSLAGTEEQKARWLPNVAAGRSHAAFALTEPGTGSDPANLSTRAVRDGDEYVLNGRKRYASFTSCSDLVVVFARTRLSSGADGVSAIVVETDRPGFRISDRIPCIGLRGHQDEELGLEDVRVPVHNRLGEEGKGLRIALATLEKTRTTLCGGFVGLARAALDAAVWYAQHRESFGRPLGEYQAHRFPMAQVQVDIEAARLLTWRAAKLDDEGRRHTAETAQAKLAATRAMLQATEVAFTVFGGFGGTQEYPVERYYRDAKIWSYAQGSPEMMNEVVARRLLESPVEEPVC